MASALPFVIADFNGDGLNDLAVQAQNASHQFVIDPFLGDPDGTFIVQGVAVGTVGSGHHSRSPDRAPRYCAFLLARDSMFADGFAEMCARACGRDDYDYSACLEFFQEIPAPCGIEIVPSADDDSHQTGKSSCVNLKLL